MTIRNPVEWAAAQFVAGSHAVESGGHAVAGSDREIMRMPIRRIGFGDIGEALKQGLSDFAACRSDVIFISLIYPLVGLLFAWALVGNELLPLLFPLASGFALVGPFVAIGLYEMSRRREAGAAVAWTDAFGVLRSPSFAAILVLGLFLVAIFVAWLYVANWIYAWTLGTIAPATAADFVNAVFTTEAGRQMMIIGVGVGFLFALVSFAVSAISFPLLLDRDVGVAVAVGTSVRAILANPAPMAAWAIIVAAGLVLGSLPLLVGLVVAMPVLGHATWHLYRRIVPRRQ